MGNRSGNASVAAHFGAVDYALKSEPVRGCHFGGGPLVNALKGQPVDVLKIEAVVQLIVEPNRSAMAASTLGVTLASCLRLKYRFYKVGGEPGSSPLLLGCQSMAILAHGLGFGRQC